MEALGINLGFIIMQVLLFIVLMLVLRGYAYDPIIRMLEERKARIAKGLEDARQAAIARDNAETDARKVLEGARSDAAKIRQDAAAGAEATRNEILSKAHEEGKEVMAKARAEAELERNRMLAELRNQIAAISIAAANKLVGEALDEKRQHELIAEFFSKAPAGMRNLSGDSAEITSALPLTDSEKDSLRKTVSVRNIEFKVNPSILGGLIVRVGDRVVDNSVAGQMSSLREAMLK